MSTKKEANGRWRAKLKSGRVDVASKTFDSKAEAEAWLVRERAALAGGVDPRSGRRRVRELLQEWVKVRKGTVAEATYKIDVDLQRVLPPGLLALQVGAVSNREIGRCFDRWIADGRAEASANRYRTSLSAFFGWCVREKMIIANPVSGVKVPRQSAEPVEMNPFAESDLDAVHARWKVENPHLADVLLVLAWTGLRWSEARSIQVRDLMEVPTPGLMVRRAAPEGMRTKSTKGRRSRRVPLANRVLPIVLAMAEGKKPTDLLITTARGSQLHRTAVLRAVHWSTTGEGRRIHDLRHTAACLWLTRGVDVPTVQAWMGHESIATTNRYVHFLGGSAHQAGLERLNSTPGGARGARHHGQHV